METTTALLHPVVLVLVAALALLSANPRETTGEKEVTVEGTSKTLSLLSQLSTID